MADQYNYSFDEVTNSYNFTTKYNICYKIAFIIDETLDSVSEESIENVYQIVIEKVTDIIDSFDGSVSKTIEIIIAAFFETVRNCLIYICSDEGEKAKVRFNVFDRWYRNSTFVESVIKIDNIIDCESSLIYTSLLYHNSNENIEKVLTAYKNIEDYLNKEN